MSSIDISSLKTGTTLTHYTNDVDFLLVTYIGLNSKRRAVVEFNNGLLLAVPISSLAYSPIEHTGYVNIYPNGETSGIYRTPEAADAVLAARSDRIKRVEFKWTE